MPGFLYKEEPINVPVYQHPMDLMGRALMVRDAKAREGLSMIRSQYDSLLNTPLTNETNQLEVRAATEQAMNKLKGLAATDISLPENQGAALNVFDNVLNNKNYLTDMAFTRHMSKQRQIIDETKKKHPEQWSPMNEYVVMKEEQKYRVSDPNDVSPNFVTYTPYTNVDKVFQDLVKELEAEEYQINASQVIDGMPIPGTRTVTQKKEDKIIARMQTAMMQDPRIAQQMGINYTYLKDSGVINPNFAVSKIEGVIKNLKDNFLVSANVSQSTKSQAQEKIAELEAVVKKIKANPSGFEEHYGFTQFTQDYLQETAASLAYAKTKPVEYDPLGIKMFESKLRREEEAMKSEMRMNEARLESSLSGTGKDGNYDFNDPRGFANNEFLTLVDKLQRTGKLSTTENDKFVRALLGGLAESKTPGYYSISKVNTTQSADPSKNIILSTPQVEMTKEDVKKVNVSIALSDYFKELEKIDPKLFKITTVSKASPFAPAYASGPDREVTTEMDLNQKIEVIKSKVQKDARFKNIVSKYQPVFDNLKFNPLDGTQLAEYMAYEGDAINAKKLKIGVALNSISGELSFKPDGSGNTVEIGDNGQAFINGVVKVPAKSVPRDVVKLLEAEGMAVDVVGETDEKDPKKTTTYYMFKAKVPSAIDLENAGMYFYGDEKDESKRSYLRQQIGAYLKTEFDTTNFEVTRNSAGVSTFSIKPNSPISSRLAQIDVDLYEKMTDGTFDFTVYKTIHDQITSLYSAKFNSRSEAAAAVKELESRLSPNDSPQSLSQRETTQAQGALQNAAQRPEFNVVRTALENEGFTPKGVSYWLGNFIQESGLNPSVVNEKEGAYGLAQWRLGRRDALEAFSGTKNPSVEDQMRFFFYELKQRVGPEEYNRIKNLTSASEIREVIKKYEGYGDEGYRTYFGQLLSEKMTTP